MRFFVVGGVRALLHIVLSVSIVFSGYPAWSYEPPLPEPGGDPINYIDMVLDANPGLSPRNLSLLRSEVFHLYKKQDEILPPAEEPGLNVSPRQEEDLTKTLYVNPISPMPYYVSQSRESKEFYIEQMTAIKATLNRQTLAAKSVSRTTSFVLGETPMGKHWIGKLLNFTTPFAEDAYLDQVQAEFQKQAFASVSSLIDSSKFTIDKLELCKGMGSQVNSCFHQVTFMNQTTLEQIFTPAQAKYLSTVIDSLLKYISHNSVRIDSLKNEDADTAAKVQVVNTTLIEIKMGEEQVVDTGAAIALAALQLSEVTEFLQESISETVEGFSKKDLTENREAISAVSEFFHGGGSFDERLNKLKQQSAEGKCGQLVDGENTACDIAAAKVEEQDFQKKLSKYKKQADAAIFTSEQLVVFMQNMQSIGIDIPEPLITVGVAVNKAATAATQVLTALVVGGPFGTPLAIIAGINGLFSIFGGGGPSAEEMRFNAIMERFDIVLNNQKIMLENQKLIYETLLKVNEGLVDLTTKFHLAQMKVLDELKTVAVANSVALSTEATEGLSRCESFRAGLTYWRAREDLTPFQRLNNHYKDYLIDYRLCIRDLLKFISYNEFSGKFNEWYFISKLSEIQEDGQAIIDTSTLASLSYLYSFKTNYYPSVEQSAIASQFGFPVNNYQAVSEKVDFLQDSDNIGEISQTTLEGPFLVNFPNYIAPGLVSRVASSYLDLFHYAELVPDPDNMSTLLNLEDYLEREEPSRRALKLLEQTLDILEVTIAQQSMLMGDIFLSKLIGQFDSNYVEPELADDFLIRLSQEIALDIQRDANRVIYSNLLVLSNTVWSKIYQTMINEGLDYNTYSYAYYDEDSSTFADLLEDFQEFRKWEEGDEEGWEVLVKYTGNSASQGSEDVERWVRLPTPEDFIHRSLSVPEDMQSLVELRRQIIDEIATYKSFIEIENQDKRKGVLYEGLYEIL